MGSRMDPKIQLKSEKNFLEETLAIRPFSLKMKEQLKKKSITQRSKVVEDNFFLIRKYPLLSRGLINSRLSFFI